MKREHVIPDSLASMTADALFAGTPEPQVPRIAVRKPASIFSLGRWLKAASAVPAGEPAARLTLDDDWVGGWYARTRLLQAATLAQQAGRETTRSSSIVSAAGHDSPRPSADAVTQFKDFS